MKSKDDTDENLRQSPAHCYWFWWLNYLDTDECDSKNESNDFNMVKPDLIDFIVVSNGDSNQISVPSATLGSLTITTSAVLFQVFSISISLVWAWSMS